MAYAQSMGVTPRMDAMASQGIRLTNYYGQSLCTPARTALMSGKFIHRTGFAGADVHGAVTYEITAWSNFSLARSTDHVFLSETLKAAGYENHGVGKWNLGHCNEALLPTARGFDSFFGYFGAGGYRRPPRRAPRRGYTLDARRGGGDVPDARRNASAPLIAQGASSMNIMLTSHSSTVASPEMTWAVDVPGRLLGPRRPESRETSPRCWKHHGGPPRRAPRKNASCKSPSIRRAKRRPCRSPAPAPWTSC